ncbi:TIGR01906 family membrane protein [Micrococcus terreus]|uniref:Integral membrane protein TIGR01906 n=1 Tax=Micrococcus terreus TaxID=574650 RepID=A0A1I7MPC2_9MICC|nr:TIGR01906 family membrane protein [Micrococcus terreus]SFV23775.1 integral membrane protein TIGR01906 [Micrococcus terreus]
MARNTPEEHGSHDSMAGSNEFESGLDYGAYVEDDGAEHGTDAVGENPTETIYRPDAGTHSTTALDRSELDAMVAGDERNAEQETPRFLQDESDDVDRRGQDREPVTAVSGYAVAPEAQPSDEPTPVGASAGLAGATAAGAGTAAAGWGREDRRREFRDAEARAAARDEALEGTPAGPRVLQVLLAIFAPIVLLIGAVRLVASPVFLWLEYHRPGFPADSYGFSTQDRVTYGSYGMDYLFNAAPSRYLGDLQAAGGPLFTESEVSHMTDVKVVMLVTMAVGLVLAVLCVLFMVSLARNAKGGIRRALFAGSLWLLVLMIALAVLAVVGWQAFFAGFHSLFFADGTWTFAASDTLIRLYPNQFWIEAGIAVAGIVVLTALITLIATWPTRRRRIDSREAQNDLVRRRAYWAEAAE